MLIKNTDELKSWLVVVLEPLCDADSSALARYVLALLKKDKPMDELKRVMIEQLDVFLGASTSSFINTLFAAIAKDDYSDPKTQAAAISGIQQMQSEIEADEISQPTYKASSITAETTSAIVTPTPTTITTTTNSAYAIKTEDEHKAKESNYVAAATAATAKNNTIADFQLEAAHSSNNHVRSVSPAAIKVTAVATADKENLPRESRRRRASLRSRSRSRSRSHERLQRRSRSRDRRANEREKAQRQYRNKSPPTAEQRHAGAGLMHERRRGGFIDRRRMSVHASILAADSMRAKQLRANRSHTRSRSPSGERPSRNKATQRAHAQDAVGGEKRQRCRDFEEQGYCLRGETCPWDHGVNPVVFDSVNNPNLINMRPAEYNPAAPEIWSRSNNATASNVLPVGSNVAVNAAANNADINPFSGAPRPGSMLNAAPSAVPFPPLLPGALEKGLNGTDYARAAFPRGAIGATGNLLPFPFNPNAMPPQLQRELIPIPVVDAGLGGVVAGGGALMAEDMLHTKRRLELEDAVALTEIPSKRKLPMNSRLGPRVPQIGNNCSLELRKVPRGMNTIAHLNNHFAKFGKIVNIQISYEGDPEAAIVTFSTHAEANVAYRSTEAVLNNRFIKVFWHNADPSVVGAVESSAAAMAGGGGVRKNSQYHLNNVTAAAQAAAAAAVPTDAAKTSNTTVAASSATTTTTDAAANAITTTAVIGSGTVTATNASPASLRMKNNLQRGAVANASIRKKQEEQAKAVVQLANGLRKRKQELLQSYVKQTKSALELVERCEPNDPQRAKTLETIKELEQKIDELRKEIALEQEQMQAKIQNQQAPPAKKTKEQQKKELLDIELELFAQQQEGNDTSAIQKRLEELQRSLGISSGANNGQAVAAHAGTQHLNKAAHFAALRASARVRPEGSTRVDRRPKTIVVTGFTSEEADFVLGHFKHFGEITKHDMDKDIPQLILSYATRPSAEQAVLRGKLFKDKRLQIAWAPVVHLPASASLVAAATVDGQLTTTADNKTLLLSEQINRKSILDDAKLAADLVDIPHDNDTLPELRLEDEEEEDETEDRSWRR